MCSVGPHPQRNQWCCPSWAGEGLLISFTDGLPFRQVALLGICVRPANINLNQLRIGDAGKANRFLNSSDRLNCCPAVKEPGQVANASACMNCLCILLCAASGCDVVATTCDQLIGTRLCCAQKRGGYGRRRGEYYRSLEHFTLQRLFFGQGIMGQTRCCVSRCQALAFRLPDRRLLFRSRVPWPPR